MQRTERLYNLQQVGSRLIMHSMSGLIIQFLKAVQLVCLHMFAYRNLTSG